LGEKEFAVSQRCKISNIFVFLLIAFGPGLWPGVQSTEGIDRLKSQIASVVRSSDGLVGVAVKHLESGRGFEVNGESWFPMASVFKLPILVEVMAQIQEGKFSLADEVSLQKSDQFLDGSLLSDLKAPGVKLSLENVINMMMWLSDNTATDILLNKVGIPAVNQRIRSYGIEKILVSRTVKEILLDYYLMDSGRYKNLSKEELMDVYKKLTSENPGLPREAEKRFPEKVADQATPLALNTLLEKIFQKKILDPSGCDFILATMLGCQTGGKRIRGLLPPETPVAHKTGTIGGTINDCGIIYLPGSLGHVALSVLSRDTDPDHTEDTIALIAKTVYDYFCFSQ
jgi:beta-lactamase class A